MGVALLMRMCSISEKTVESGGRATIERRGAALPRFSENTAGKWVF